MALSNLFISPFYFFTVHLFPYPRHVLSHIGFYYVSNLSYLGHSDRAGVLAGNLVTGRQEENTDAEYLQSGGILNIFGLTQNEQAPGCSVIVA